jgi:hypothetical protein
MTRWLADDLTYGRLQVICRDCGEWNLTPNEDRWDPLEECEAAFRGATIRAPTGGR